MDFSKLTSNEKLAVYGAIASVIGPVLASMGFGFGAGFVTLLLALAMLAIVFLPQLSPGTTLPGSKGTLMLIVGGIAGVSALLALLGSFGYLAFFGSNIVFVLGWLIGIAGGLMMGWAGWQEFQAEGGTFRLGTPTTSTPRDAVATGSVDRTDTTVDRTDAAPVLPPTVSSAPAERSAAEPPAATPSAPPLRDDDRTDPRPTG
jgi:hypothetical protein